MTNDRDKDREEHEGVKVVDKRRFNDDGSSRATEAGTAGPDKLNEAGPAQGSSSSADGKARAEAESGPTNAQTREFPAVDFVTFILSLTASAQVHLGVIANPATGKSQKDLGLAKQTIDLIGMLAEKTKGNLTER